jgi:hypothetical protein
MHSVNVKLTDDVSSLTNTYLLKFNITRTVETLPGAPIINIPI